MAIDHRPANVKDSEPNTFSIVVYDHYPNVSLYIVKCVGERKICYGKEKFTFAITQTEVTLT